jgi:hypothetical protein
VPVGMAFVFSSSISFLGLSDNEASDIVGIKLFFPSFLLDLSKMSPTDSKEAYCGKR